MYILLDQSDVDLRHALANLIAFIVGSPHRSNHLWYHLFAPEELENTYMTGFMVKAQQAASNFCIYALLNY